MVTASSLIIYRYSPENIDEVILRKIFVGREILLKNIVKEIEEAARKKTPRFFLIVGPRGIGKSHFLVLLYHEIRNKLGSMLVPIKLREEEYSVYRASDLFLRILEEKKEDTKEILSLANEDEILHASIERLKLISKRDGKRFIIFIENLHELFRQLDFKELQKLRSIFQKNDFFSVVASAPMIFSGISEHDEPFYNFFQIQFLSEFSLEEIKELIQKIAEVENNYEFLNEFKKYEPKIHGLAHLTCGSPRLVILFYEMITRGELENIENAFFKIIDEHTPYYQEIFQLLTGQKRKIFDAVISSEAPITPKQISKETRLDLPTVTTQLRRLETDGYVISRPMGRITKYEVRERLFRLWREMRQPLGRKRVSILLEFLQYWYTPEERKELFRAKFEMFEDGKKMVLRDLCYYAEILPPEFKVEALLKFTPKLIELGELEEAAHEIMNLKTIATQDRNNNLEGVASFYEGRLLLSKNRYDDALEAFSKALEAFNKVLDVNPNDRFALSMKGTTLVSSKMYGEALETLDKVLEGNPNDEFALLNRGYVLQNLRRYEEALKTYNKVIEINPKNEFVLLNIGDVLRELDKNEEALVVYNKILEINPRNEYVLSNKGITLRNLDRHKDALEAFNRVLEINPKNELARSMKGFSLIFLGEYENALKALNSALEANPKDEHVLSMKGFLLGTLDKDKEALEAFNKALEINPKSEFSLSWKSSALINLEQYEESLEILTKMLEINPKDDTALRNRGIALLKLKRYIEALEMAKKAKHLATDDSIKVGASLTLIEANLSLGRKTDAFIEIEELKDKIADQKPNMIESFIEFCLNLTHLELKAGNHGNAAQLIKMAYAVAPTLTDGKVAAMTIAFLKDAIDSEPSVIKMAVEEIMKQQEGKYGNLLRFIIKAMEIVKSKDIQKYYDIHIEEREIVADIVREITKSDELLPEEIKRKETRLTDYSAT